MSPILPLILIALLSSCTSGHLDVLYRWRTIDFEFPNETVRRKYIENEDYIPGVNSLPLDVDIWHGGTFFK